jgi:hypothetical protein
MGFRPASPPPPAEGLLAPPEYDMEIVYEAVDVLVDPVVVCNHDLTDDGLQALGARREELRTLVNGIQVHRCPHAEPGKIYLLDRRNVVDDDGLCLVCGGPTV